MVRIALVQQRATADKKANVERGLQAVDEAASRGAQLVGFAELAFEPFYPRCRPLNLPFPPASGGEGMGVRRVHALAEPIPGPTTATFAERARKHGLVIVLNLFERDGDRCFDTSPVIDADGSLLGRTRMIHITDYEGFHEQDYYTPGDTGAPVYDTKVGRIGVAICYDRHYPEFMRALAVQGADLVVVPQAGTVGEWPDGLYEGEMRVAAFQNGYFTALCNRVGREETLDFSGESFVCSPEGVVIARAPKCEEGLLLADIDLAAARDSHARRLFLRDRRPDLYSAWVSPGTAAV
jgi:N-carbamoylputrescine amidase